MFLNVSLHLWLSSYSCLKLNELLESQKLNFSKKNLTERVSSVKLLISSLDSSAKLFKRATTGSSELSFKKNLIL